MVFIPEGWNDNLRIDRYQMKIEVEGWEIPMEMVSSSTWIAEEDLTMMTIPLNEFDFTLNNVNGEFDRDNPESLLYRLPINGEVDPVLIVKCDDDVVYEFPLGVFILSQLSYSGTDLIVTCFDPTVALQTYEGAEEIETEMSQSDFLNQICADAMSVGVPLQLDEQGEEPEIMADYWLELGKSYSNKGLFAGMDTGYNLANYPDTSIDGVTLSFSPMGGAMATLVTGTPSKIGVWEFATNIGTTITIGVKPSSDLPVYKVDVVKNKAYENQIVVSFRGGCPNTPTGATPYTIGGLTFTRTTQMVAGAIVFSGTPTTTGTTSFPLYEYLTPTSTASPRIVAYVQINVASTEDHLILVKFRNGESLTFLDSLCILFKTILDGHYLKKTRDGKLLITYKGSFQSKKENKQNPYPKLEKVMDFPQPESNGNNTNTVRITYTDELTEEDIVKIVQLDDTIVFNVTEYLDSPIEAQDLDSEVITSNGYWAEAIAKRYLNACAVLDPYSVKLFDSPEIECGDLLFTRGKYGMYPLYVKKVTMEFNGDLISTVEGARLPTSTWYKYRMGWRWEEVKKYTWGEIFTEYRSRW